MKFLALVILTIIPALGAADTYGGDDTRPCVGGASTHFYSEKLDGKWWLCTPSGNVFWSVGLLSISNSSATGDTGTTLQASLTAKYGDTGVTAAPETLRRLRSWRFNTLSDAGTGWPATSPWATDAGWPGDHTQPVKLSKIWDLPYSTYVVRNVFSQCSQAGKTVPQGVDTAVWPVGVYLGQFTDPFDPCFSTSMNSFFSAPDPSWSAAFNSPYTIAVATDESDYYSFAGAGPDFPMSGGDPIGHAGLEVLVGSPRQTANEFWKIIYPTDQKFYAKYEFADWLRGLTEETIGATAARSGSTVTYTVGSHPYNVGDVLTVKVCSDSTFNTVAGTGVSVTSISGTTVVATLAGAGSSATGCTVTTGPGYANVAGLNSAWGSSYTGWGTDETIQSQTISTQGTPGDCNRTTWVCSGTLTSAPDKYSAVLKIGSTMVAGSTASFIGTGAAYVPACSITAAAVASNVVTITCSTAVGFPVGKEVAVYVVEDHTLNGYTFVVTAVNGNTFSYALTYGDETINPATGDAWLTEAIDTATGGYTLQFPAAAQPGATDTISIAYYTGGFGSGSGFLDENGSSAWLTGCNQSTLVGCPAAAMVDLNNFLYHFSKTYFKVERDAVKANYPSLMYMGGNVVGSWCAPPRQQVAKAAGQYFDLIRTQICPGANFQSIVDFWGTHAGDKPLGTAIYMSARADSSLSAYAQGGDTYQTQAARASAYSSLMSSMQTMQYTAHGTRPFVMSAWWGYVDDFGEHQNWGLVTTRDNAYDGVEARTGAQACVVPPGGTIAEGYNCGSEAGNYGDVITSVKAANALWLTGTPAPGSSLLRGITMTGGSTR